MGIAAEIVKYLLERSRGHSIEEVRIGLGYTAVLLSQGRLGVSYTFRDKARGGCTVFHGLRPLAGREASDVLQLLESADPIESGVGLACANALANGPREGIREGDVLADLDLHPEDHVGMVGNFGPLAGPLKERVASLKIFERVPAPRGDLRPASEALEALPGCQAALITATTIVNRTIDGLLEAARGCRTVSVMGPSTPMLPDVFAPRGVTLLSGILVDKPRGLLQVVSEGGGMRQFGPFVRKVNLPLEASRDGRGRTTPGQAAG